jgi:uncharacterized damage-inducible protein DinB
VKPDEVRELFEYLIETRSRFLEKCRALGWTEFAKNRGATWESMLAIFLHMLDNEEGWWQIALQGGSLAETPDRKPADYANFDAVATDNERVGALTRSRLSKLSEADLARSVDFRARDTITRSFERIVLHAFVDEVAHVGELVCLLWQVGIEPPFIDWLDYRTD